MYHYGKQLFILTSLLSPSVMAFNVAYVEVNSNHFGNVACYVDAQTQKPFFSMASIFAANINGSNPNHPVIYTNPEVSATLQSTQIADLQKKGIKVLVTILGNHENAGWSCMTDAQAAKRFADDVVAFVNQFHLDGIDIDDEYSNCATNNTSMIMMAQAIKTHPEFKGKLLTKALFSDYNYFRANYQGHYLSEYLDYGWEMSYFSSDFKGRLASYLQAGMTMSKLMVGGWTHYAYPDPYKLGVFTTQNNAAGAMVYDVKTNSQSYLTSLQQGLKNNQAAVDVLPGCLQ